MHSANYANRGKSLEYLINFTNQQYLAKRVALVQYIPTDWTVIRRGTQIISAFPDVRIMLDQIEIILGVDTWRIRQGKLERLSERMQAEGGNKIAKVRV